MKMHYNRQCKQVGLLFEEKDLRFAHAVLVWLRMHFKPTAQSEGVILEVENMLVNPKPMPQLSYVVDNRLCTKCCRMINLKKDRYIHRTENGDSNYVHQECPKQTEKE